MILSGRLAYLFWCDYYGDRANAEKEYSLAALFQVGGDLSVAEVIGRHQGTKE